MAEKAPSTVSAAAICQASVVNATAIADRPMPWKKTSIMRRRPHRSPSRPAGTEPRPNMKKAPAV